MQVIRKEHNGHLDEITGIIQTPATPAAERGPLQALRLVRSAVLR
jgi:hypothetical protein